MRNRLRFDEIQPEQKRGHRGQEWSRPTRPMHSAGEADPAADADDDHRQARDPEACAPCGLAAEQCATRDAERRRCGTRAIDAAQPALGRDDHRQHGGDALRRRGVS
jgi:hypothetical protein